MAQTTHDLADSLIFLTNRVGRLLSNEVRKRLGREEDAHILQPHHINVLVDLWMQDGVRQQDLAVSTIKDKGTIARILDFLERKNLVVRVTDRADKRNKRIYLTHEGKKMKHELMPHAESVTDGASTGIREEDLDICRKVLVKIYNNLIK